jgi:hypothetical protein
MKLNAAAFFCLLSLQTHAEIIQHNTIIVDAFTAVHAGQQRNGTLAIEQLFTRTTTSAQDALSPASITFNDGAAIEGSRPTAAAPSTFSALTLPDVQLPSSINPPLRPITPVVPPLIAAVPEPETYALLALGLSAVYFRRRSQQQR